MSVWGSDSRDLKRDGVIDLVAMDTWLQAGGWPHTFLVLVDGAGRRKSAISSFFVPFIVGVEYADGLGISFDLNFDCAGPRQDGVMKTLVVLLVGMVAVVLLLAFARYETIAPCGMLRAEAKRHVLRDVASEAPRDGLEAIGVALGASVTNFVLEGLVERFS